MYVLDLNNQLVDLSVHDEFRFSITPYREVFQQNRSGRVYIDYDAKHLLSVHFNGSWHPLFKAPSLEVIEYYMRSVEIPYEEILELMTLHGLYKPKN